MSETVHPKKLAYAARQSPSTTRYAMEFDHHLSLSRQAIAATYQHLLVWISTMHIAPVILIQWWTDEDSDPEFNSGVFVAEPRPKKGRKKKDATNSPMAPAGSRKRKRRSDAIDYMSSPSTSKIKLNMKSTKSRSGPKGMLPFYSLFHSRDAGSNAHMFIPLRCGRGE